MGVRGEYALMLKNKAISTIKALTLPIHRLIPDKFHFFTATGEMSGLVFSQH